MRHLSAFLLNRRAMLWLFGLVGAAASLLLLFWFVLAWLSVHPPRTPLFLSPYDFGIPFQNVQFPSRDGLALRGWWMPHPHPRGVLLVCHGYLVNRCEIMGVAALLYTAGFSILAFDFRAHGKSGGRTCTLGAREAGDIQGALDWLDQTAPGLPVGAFGSSMGGAAVILAAAQDMRLRAIATDCAFCAAREAGNDWWNAQAGRRWGVLLRPINTIGAWLAKTSLRDASPRSTIGQIAPRPLLLLHAEGDRLVPVRHAHALYEAAGEPKRLQLFPGSGHVQARADQPAEFYVALLPFFEQTIRYDTAP